MLKKADIKARIPGLSKVNPASKAQKDNRASIRLPSMCDFEFLAQFSIFGWCI
jgi:hypothetical protein